MLCPSISTIAIKVFVMGPIRQKQLGILNFKIFKKITKELMFFYIFAASKFTNVCKVLRVKHNPLLQLHFPWFLELHAQTSKIDRLINGTYRLPCLSGSTVRGCCKNALGRGSTSSGTYPNLSKLLFFRYLWLNGFKFCLCHSAQGTKESGATVAGILV